MGQSHGGIVTLCIGVAALAAAGNLRAGPVDLELRPASQTVNAGDVVRIELVAAPADGTDQAVGLIGAVLTWDARFLSLLGHDGTDAFPWASAGFPSDGGGVNTTFDDGTAYFQGVVAQEGPLATVTAEGLLVTTLEFLAVSGSTGPSPVAMVDCISTTCTVVLDEHPFNNPGDVTGTRGGPVDVTVHCASNADCDDGNPCTDDVCEVDSLCTFTIDDTNDPDDGLFCNGREVCDGGEVIVQPGSVPNCSDGLTCTTDVCEEASNSCRNDLQVGYCLIDGACFAAGALNPSNDCEVCDPATRTSAWTPRAADAACGSQTETGCNRADTCDGAGTCLANLEPAGTPCGSGTDTVCTDPDTCDGAGSCLKNHAPDGTACDDGRFCTPSDACLSGACRGTGNICDDLACDETLDTCKGVDLLLSTVQTEPHAVGDSVFVELWALSATGTDQPISAVSVILDWDESRLALTGLVNNGPYDWFQSDLPDDSGLDGLNNTFNDGDALYQASRQPAPNPPAVATTSGLLVVTFEFEADTAGTAQIKLVAARGEHTQTQVVDAETSGLDILTGLGDPVTADIVDCFTDAQCDDGEFCNGVETCSNNDCVPGVPPDCDDGLFCNGAESCVSGIGCVSAGNPCPVPESCDEASDDCGGCAAPAVAAVGSRYFAITPRAGDEPLAIAISGAGTELSVSCVSGYVQADGTIGPSPVFLAPTEWSTVYLTGAEIVPRAPYWFQSDCRADGTGFLSNIVEARPWRWGDTNGNGSVDIDDALRVADFMNGQAAPDVIMPNVDLVPCAPDGVVDDPDQNAAFDALNGVAFPCEPPCDPCGAVVTPQVPAGSVLTNRYLVIDGGNEGLLTALRVIFDDLPAPYDQFNGQALWVGEPMMVCENAGQDIEPAEGCFVAPGQPRRFPASTLRCEPFYTDWSQIGTVAVFDEIIVPGGQYSVQAILDICDPGVAGHFSPALVMETGRWADVVSDCSTDPCGPPNGIVDVQDVIALLDKFQNVAGAPAKVRADIEPAVVDMLIGISDVIRVLDAFTGVSYPFPPPAFPCP